MALRKIKLGDYISQCNEKNDRLELQVDDVRGVSTQKMFIETKANMDGVPLNNYRIVRPNQFAYVPDTSRRGDKISLAFNNTNESFLISSISVVFSVNENVINPEYLFMYFNRPEFDRYSRYNSFGSAREPFNWEDMCDIEIELPDLQIQQKYVDVYLSMIENQKAYEKGLDDLKLVCDAYIENLRRNIPCKKIGTYIKEESNRNNKLRFLNIQGVNSSSLFGDTKADTNGLDFTNYKIVEMDQFAYNPSRINVGSIALYSKEEKCIVSPMYIVFSIINKECLLPEYLMLWLSRKEFHRSTLFYAIGSVRDTFDFNLMKDVVIPIPDVKTQHAIVDIYKCYVERKEINERLKKQIKEICPILIKGSIEEGLNEQNNIHA